MQHYHLLLQHCLLPHHYYLPHCHFLIHCSYAAEAVSYYKKNLDGEIDQIDFKDLKAPKRRGGFANAKVNRSDNKLQEEAQKVAEDATKGHDVALVTGRIGELLKEGKKIVLL